MSAIPHSSESADTTIQTTDMSNDPRNHGGESYNEVASPPSTQPKACPATNEKTTRHRRQGEQPVPKNHSTPVSYTDGHCRPRATTT